MKKLIIIVVSFMVISGLAGFGSINQKFDTSKLKQIGENSYIFPTYEILLNEVPFKSQLPTYIPFSGASARWIPNTIITNKDLTEVVVSFTIRTFLDEVRGPASLTIDISNSDHYGYKENNSSEKIKINGETTGYFSSGSSGNIADLTFKKKGVYYNLNYWTETNSTEEKKKELVKIASSMVNYDKWFEEYKNTPKFTHFTN